MGVGACSRKHGVHAGYLGRIDMIMCDLDAAASIAAVSFIT